MIIVRTHQRIGQAKWSEELRKRIMYRIMIAGVIAGRILSCEAYEGWPVSIVQIFTNKLIHSFRLCVRFRRLHLI